MDRDGDGVAGTLEDPLAGSSSHGQRGLWSNGLDSRASSRCAAGVSVSTRLVECGRWHQDRGRLVRHLPIDGEIDCRL
jgi:hypothetical protein